MLPFPVGGYDSDSDSISAMDDETIKIRTEPHPPVTPKKGRKRKDPGDLSEVEYSSDNCKLGLDTDLIHTSCSDLSGEENESGIDQIRMRKIRKLNTFEDDSPSGEDQDEISRMLATPSGNMEDDSQDGTYTRFNCFACRFIDKKQDATNPEKVKRLLRIFEDGYGLKDNLTLARLCHLYFKHEIYLPMRKDGKKIEMWRSKQVLNHFTSMNHIIDPRIYIGEMIRELNAIRVRNKRFLFKRVKHRNGVTEEMQNDKAIKSLLDIHSKIMLLFKAKPEEMNFFDPKNTMDLSNFSKGSTQYQNFENREMDTVDPLSEISRRPPQLGVHIRGPPIGLGQNRPQWFEGAPISFADGLEASPSLSTDYASGIPTNLSNNLPKIVKCFRDELMVAKQIGQLVLARKERKKRYPGQSRVISYAILNIPAWNHFQASTYKMPQSWEEVKSAEDFFKDWYVEGVVATETGEKGKFYDQGSLEERLLNITVRGQAHTYKGWTGELTVGTKLFLILKKSDLPSRYHCHVSNGIRSNAKPKSWCLSFWAEKDYDRPPQSELEYLDEFGFRHIGKAIYVGSVLNIRGALFDTSSAPNIHRNFEALLTRPKISIIVDPSV